MTSLLERIQTVMDASGYGQLTQGKTLADIISIIDEKILPVDDVDPTELWEDIHLELKDDFFDKNGLDITMFISDSLLEQLYGLLCEYKQQ